uniref:POPLD domain-containing protein n=1 Tax=Syphacia muris TaxID=451379 RepID=A0A0N5A9C2_9BILA
MDCREQFTRFRLYGPKAFAILKDVLHTVSEFKSSSEWMSSFNCHLLRSSNAFWRDELCFRTFEELPNGLMLNLLVSDPRISMNFKKKKPKVIKKSYPSLFDFRAVPPISPYFWDTEMHKLIVRTRISDEELQKRRRDNLPPVELSSSQIPLLLVVRNTGVGTSKTFNGVDIVIPVGFGEWRPRDFWLCLQYGTARAIGFKDQKHIEFESDILNFPCDVPDCDAGIKVLKEEHKQLKCFYLMLNFQAKYIARPYNRRLQFKKNLHIKHPFSFAWNYLIDHALEKEYSRTKEKYFYVLRDRSSLKSIDQWLRGKAPEPVEVLKAHPFSLVPIQLEAKYRGCPGRYGYIYIPNKSDLHLTGKEKFKIIEESKPVSTGNEKMKSNERIKRKCRIRESCTKKEDEKKATEIKGYVPLSENATEKLVNLNQLFPSKETHRALLRKRRKVLATKRRREKECMAKRRKEEACIAKTDEREKASTSDDDDDFSSKSGSDDLHQRRIVGRIVRGDYSFSSAKGKGVGYCATCCLKYIRDGKVLFRNVTSKYYHFAKLSVNRQQIGV